MRINSTDATTGQDLRTRVETRKHELEGIRDALPAGAERVDVEHALDAIGTLLTGDLDNIPNIVSQQLNEWLEHNKHLAERTEPPPPPPVPLAGPTNGSLN